MLTQAAPPDEKHLPPEVRDKILHGRLNVKCRILIASDAPPGTTKIPRLLRVDPGQGTGLRGAHLQRSVGKRDRADAHPEDLLGHPLRHWYIGSVDTGPKEFKDVTIYTSGNVIWPNIIRIDVTRVRIWVAPYAQYKESVYVKFMRKGKRKTETLVSSGKPYVVVVPTTHAIQPDDLYLPVVEGVASTRYDVADPRWRTDFDDQLRLANISILADYRDLSLEAKTVLRPEINGDQSPATPPESATDSRYELVDFEYEEGLRHQAERNFFNRNPQLVKQVKESRGCICWVCGFDFAKTYGALGLDFAEAHHLNPLSERPPEEWTTTVQTNIADIAILCANCHRMIHRRKPALSIDELKAILIRDI